MYLKRKNIMINLTKIIVINSSPDSVHKEGSGNHSVASHLAKIIQVLKIKCRN